MDIEWTQLRHSLLSAPQALLQAHGRVVRKRASGADGSGRQLSQGT